MGYSMKLWRAVMVLSVGVLVLGCDMAPLSIASYVEPGAIQSGRRTVNVEALLREGRYCADVRLAKDGNSSFSETEEFFDGRVNLRYSVEIPNTNVSREVDLGLFDPEDFGGLYEGGFSWHQFTVEVSGADSPRSTAYIEAVLEGEEEVVSQAKLGVKISEWPCK